MKVINLFAGPGAGKSTIAAGVFFQLKIRDIKCELVTEYAKDMTYEGRDNILQDQLYILAKQNRRLERLNAYFERANKESGLIKKHDIDAVVCDCPLIMMLAYVQPYYYPGFGDMVRTIFDSYQNINFFIQRVKPYQTYGRSQTYEQALEKDLQIATIIKDYHIPITMIDGDKDAPVKIVDHLQRLGLIVSSPN
jgi:hypothetical protein